MTQKLLVGTRKGFFTLKRGKCGFQITRADHLGIPVPMTLADHRDGRLHVALDHGHFGTKFHCSEDGGKSWLETTTPTFPEKPHDFEESDGMNKVVDWDLKKVWSLTAGGADQPGVLWCGTIPGGLFRSDDGGETWNLNEALWLMPERQEWFGGGADLPGLHSILVHPSDSDHVTVAISCGGVWQTTDGGETWACRADGMFAEYMPEEQARHPNIQDPHCIVRCVSEPDVLWCQHHNGIFRSTDGAQSWQSIENDKPGVFGFAVAVDPNDSNTAWFVPAVKDEMRIPRDGRLLVSRTCDGGETFEELGKGLPDKHAYDLTLRHALDVDDAGSCLAFGTTTGSLFVSEDRGDSWKCVASNLPPIYCVDWATTR